MLFYSRSSPEHFCEHMYVGDLFCTAYFKKENKVFASDEGHITGQHQEH